MFISIQSSKKRDYHNCLYQAFSLRLSSNTNLKCCKRNNDNKAGRMPRCSMRFSFVFDSKCYVAGGRLRGQIKQLDLEIIQRRLD